MRVHSSIRAGMVVLLSTTPSLMFAQAVEGTRAGPNAAVTPADAHQAETAKQQVSDAAQVVGRMKQDEDLARLMQQARGIFIVPNYGKASLGVGGTGGLGVLVLRNAGTWSHPAFYTLTSISVGAQAGVAVGAMAMLLMTDKAVNTMKSTRTFSINATAGLTVADYSTMTNTSNKPSDVIAWSETKGLFAGVAIAVTNIAPDTPSNTAYYGERVTPQQIFSGSVTSPNARPLMQALAQTSSR